MTRRLFLPPKNNYFTIVTVCTVLCMSVVHMHSRKCEVKGQLQEQVLALHCGTWIQTQVVRLAKPAVLPTESSCQSILSRFKETTDSRPPTYPSLISLHSLITGRFLFFDRLCFSSFPLDEFILSAVPSSSSVLFTEKDPGTIQMPTGPKADASGSHFFAPSWSAVTSSSYSFCLLLVRLQ